MKTEQFVVVHDETDEDRRMPDVARGRVGAVLGRHPRLTVHRLHPASGKYSSWKMDASRRRWPSTSTTT